MKNRVDHWKLYEPVNWLILNMSSNFYVSCNLRYNIHRNKIKSVIGVEMSWYSIDDLINIKRYKLNHQKGVCLLTNCNNPETGWLMVKSPDRMSVVYRCVFFFFFYVCKVSAMNYQKKCYLKHLRVKYAVVANSSKHKASYMQIVGHPQPQSSEPHQTSLSSVHE